MATKAKKLPRELKIEVAHIRDEIPLYGGLIPNPDKVLQRKGGNFETYEDLETDPHVRTVIAKRKRAVISREWFVNEADESPEAEKSAELVRSHIEKIGIDSVTLGFLDAVLKGFSIGEVMWVQESGEVRPAKIKFRKQQRFTFVVSDKKGYELRLLRMNNSLTGIPVPERKFIRYTHDERYDNPYGFGLGNSLFWPVFFKRKGITFWLTFCDKFGSPTSVGKYPASATKPERDKLLEALQAIAQDAGVIVPEGMDIALLEAAKSGIDSYEKLVRYMDEQISEVVLGETGTTNQSGDSGSRARDEIGNEVRLETAKYDADALCEVLNETLVKWIIDFNMPGAPYPRLWRDFSEPEDLVQKAQRDKSLTETGVKLRKKYYIREYNLQEDDFDLVEPKPKDRATDQRPGNPAEFATAESSDVAKLAEAFAEKSGKPMELLLKPLKKLVEESQSYDEMLDKLLDVYEDLDPTALGVIMENAMVLSELKGRSEVVDGE